MSKIKKLVLGLSVMLTMAIAFVVGVVGLQQNKTSSGRVADNEFSTSVPRPKPTSYTYAPNQVQVVKGGDTLNFVYQPDSLSQATSYVKAYEYIFGSTMDETMAVNLKYINTSEVNVSYAYSKTPLDTTQSITTQSIFTTQLIENKGDYVYIYIFIDPINNYVPTYFTKDIVWWFGVVGTLSVTNPATNQTFTQTIVKGQEVDVEFVKASMGIDIELEWFYDEECTIPVTGSLLGQNKPLYIKLGVLANLPEDWLTLDGDHYVVTTGLSELPADLVIPSEYNGKPVTTIGDSAFKDNETITSVTIPEGITGIGVYAFSGCSGLTSIDLSGCTNLTSIDIAAFFDCSGLTSIDLRGCTSLTSIGVYAFAGCSELTSITLPSSLTSIANGAFWNCSGLERIVVESGNPVYDSRNNCNAIIETSTNTLIIGCKNTIIPNDITSIGNSGAFYGCSGLTSITLPSSLTIIGDFAFNGCSELTDVYYAGSESEFAKISIASTNKYFTNATIHYNYSN